MEFDYGGSCVRPEYSVNLSGIEAQAPEAELEIRDVVTPEHRGMEVQVSVTQTDPGLDESRVGLFVEKTGLLQRAFGLECKQDTCGVGTKFSFVDLTRVDAVAGRVEAAMEVLDGRAPITGFGNGHGWVDRPG